LKKEVIILKTREEIGKMRKSNLVVAEILEILKENVRPGASTMDLELITEEETKKRGVLSAFKGYKDYPYCLCTSVNNEVVHGMPSKGKVLKDGDILSIDFGVLSNGYYGDAAVTVPVGRVKPEAKRLMDVTAASLDLAIRAAEEDGRLMDISAAVQRHVEAAGFSVVREFVGHGIGRELHEPPQVPNFGIAGRGIRLRAGMVLAIEPMVNAGTSEVRILDDGWTAVTADGGLSAHFEHTVAITPDGPYVLSRP
jgi:methionyl aminopeptidase